MTVTDDRRGKSTAATLAQDETLPTHWYTDPAIYRLECERIFGASWQYVGHADRLSRPGDYLCAQVGGVPVVVTRDETSLNALVNVCRHRQHLVAEGDGHGQTLQCPYHGWTYNLDGSLRAAPRADREVAFDRTGLSLRTMAIDTWGPLVFVNPGESPGSLAAILGDLPSLIRARGVKLEECVFRARRRHDFACNWKTYVENSLECYHCPIAHPTFSQMVDVRPDVYTLRTYDWFSEQTSRRRQPDNGTETDRNGESFQFYYLWPNLFLGTATGVSSYAVHRIVPLDVDHSRLTLEYYFAAEIDDATVEEQVEFNTITLNEDRALVESVQTGLSSGAIGSGRLMLGSELLLQHFQQLVARALSDEMD